MPFHVLFVCSGNTCRSPLAEAIARRLLGEQGLDGVEVSSAGTFATSGGKASSGSLEIARAHGLDLEAFSSRPLTAEAIAGADLVVVMEPGHRSAVLGLDPQADTKTRLIGELSGTGGPEGTVPDPFGGSVEEYRKTYERIERLLRAGLERIRELAVRKQAGRRP